MGLLSTPSKELISRVLNAVDYEDRIIGYRVRKRSGAIMMPMYYFAEVVDFLHDKLPHMDFEELQRWLREVIKDKELAIGVSEIVSEES